jgi:hypothetical protein
MDYLKLNELYHHGIKGQKWGIRNYQNEDGTLTAEGYERYKQDIGKMTMKEKKNSVQKRYAGLSGVASARSPCYKISKH